MQIALQAHVLQERTVTVSEEDLAGFYDLVKDVFLHYVRDFYTADPPEDIMWARMAVVAMCKRHGINPEIAQDRSAFFEALLGISPLDPGPLKESDFASEKPHLSLVRPCQGQTPGQMG